MQALSKFRDALFECGHCKRETAYDRDVLKAGANLACVWCKREIATPTRMKIGPAVVMLSPQMRLYPHHLGETADFSAPVAESHRAHPTKPNTWGLRTSRRRRGAIQSAMDRRPRLSRPGGANQGRPQGRLRARGGRSQSLTPFTKPASPDGAGVRGLRGRRRDGSGLRSRRAGSLRTAPAARRRGPPPVGR